MARSPAHPATILVFGNGLTLSFLEHAGDAMSAWNTSRPLSWKIVHEPTGQTLEECFPAFYAQAAHLRAANPEWSDFQIIDQIVSVAQAGMAVPRSDAASK